LYWEGQAEIRGPEFPGALRAGWNFLEHQPEAHRSRRFEVALGFSHGINDRASGVTAAAEEIRRGDHRVGVQVLAQDHERGPSSTG
jgi:hypothetical protein